MSAPEELIRSTTLVTVTYSDGSIEEFDPNDAAYPVRIIVQTTSVIAPGLVKAVK